MQQSTSVLNIAAYKFVALDELPALRVAVREQAFTHGLKGTVLLAPEGINLFLAGAETAVDAFLAWLRSDTRFADLHEKRSYSAEQPFGKLLVKLKKEIIPLGEHNVDPSREPAPRVDAATLKAWLDEGRDVLLLDTRNRFEVDKGAFVGAVSLGIDQFRTFPEHVKTHLAEWRDKTIVTYCTGGIRCEKAAPVMRRMGFADVYQLDGGILKYFEEVGSAHYDGTCTVFDERGAVDPQLKPAN